MNLKKQEELLKFVSTQGKYKKEIRKKRRQEKFKKYRKEEELKEEKEILTGKEKFRCIRKEAKNGSRGTGVLDATNITTISVTITTGTTMQYNYEEGRRDNHKYSTFKLYFNLKNAAF